MGSGERLNGIQEVSGSIPLISTKSPEIERFWDFFFSKIEICWNNKQPPFFETEKGG